MSDLIPSLVADLAAEQAQLAGFLMQQPAESWMTATPAVGWNVRDQVAHLAHFDRTTRLAISHPDVFAAFSDSLPDLQTYVDEVGPENAHRSAEDLLAWWNDENLAMREAALRADLSQRVPWFGTSMTLASKLTARLMETWAHGQDVFDALGARRAPSERLKHVARLGVQAFPNSFRAHDREVPDAPVYVALATPNSSDRWTWGDPASANSVRGDIEDFCLVVTQRRHVQDTTLEVRGHFAAEWMSIAQAFAGPPGAGRRPGQFRISDAGGHR